MSTVRSRSEQAPRLRSWQALRLRSGRALAVLWSLTLAPFLFAGSPRVTFERVLPATHDLGAEDIAIVQAIGDQASIETFIDVFVEQVNKSQVLRMRDARRSTGPADAFLDIKTFTCEMAVREGEGSTRDIDNKRVRRRYFWADAVCTARVDVLSNTMHRVSTFHVRGEGTSPRVATVGDDERRIALDQAARYAAISAAERITPRRVRETIALDDKAPAFEEGMAMIDSGRLAQARGIWVAAMRTQPRSAALRFNLGAVCEALGDRRAAEQHYMAARELAPNEPRYALELKLFQKRQ
jgi:tetratricopeptide (TPR) repeat protein